MLGTCNYVFVLILPFWTKPLALCKIREILANFLITSIEEVKFSPLIWTYQIALLMWIKHQDLNQRRLLTTLGREFSVGFNVRHFHEKQTSNLDLVTKMWYVPLVTLQNFYIGHKILSKVYRFEVFWYGY